MAGEREHGLQSSGYLEFIYKSIKKNPQVEHGAVWVHFTYVPYDILGILAFHHFEMPLDPEEWIPRA